MPRWTLRDIPDLTGRTAMVTGGNAGLGFRSVLELARKGARVMLACRRTDKGDAAADRIRSELPDARLETVVLELTDPVGIERFADRVASRTNRLDILLNNAAAVGLAVLRRTPLGHEMHIATNHYGHFLVTGHLLPLLVATPGARVVTVTSAAHLTGAIDLEDLDWRARPYNGAKAYADSKMASLLFMRELQARLDAAGAAVLSVAAHPGMTATGPRRPAGIGRVFDRLLFSRVDAGVRPQLRAATDPAAKKLDFYGPRFGLRGAPRRIRVRGAAGSGVLARRLWKVTEEVTGFRYEARASGSAPDSDTAQ
ncbi:MAG: SDR family NAD(P)-dependent oxidoreductase [Gammaproteobacteria bacterium]|nr:SDR family NAD(P)-dependent oxidoreductase [Gammaproteobacteria bacterium]